MSESGGQPSLLKRALLMPLLAPGMLRLLTALTDTQAVIFMLHRFSMPDLGVSGHPVGELRKTLAHLRRERCEFTSVQEMFRRLREGLPLKRAVAFTIDDGYRDHALVGAPVFAEFDCPVTTYVVTGFLDGKVWMWWDQLSHIFESTKRTELRASLGPDEIEYRLDSMEARRNAARDLSLRCQDATQANRQKCISKVSLEADVEIPETAPPRFAAMTWDEARAAEKSGMTFGPHTVTHPVLSSTSPEQAEFEIAESWRQLNAEIGQPVPVFCYPSGRARDYGPREIQTIRRCGLWGAVVGQPGKVRPKRFRATEDARFQVSRYGYADHLPHVLQCVSGLEDLKSRLRGGRG